MKLFERKRSVVISTLAIIIVLVALFLNQAKLFAVFRPEQSAVTRIKASSFVPVDSNQQMVRKNARLIVVEDFHATQLNNNRNLHIYLPPSYYKEQTKKFPVLYVHDGKSIFELSDWSKESLNMHTTADRLIAEKKITEVIIVGIDNIGEMRTSEYAHWDGIDMGKTVIGNGLQYEDFVVNEVKPFVDNNFRTFSDAKNTALMGASIGGFATFNIGYRNSHKFSKLAMLSPYLGWGDNRLYRELTGGIYKEKKPLKMYIDVGSKEGGFIDMAALGVLTLLNNGYKYVDELVAYEASEGEHSERSWAQRVESVLLYFYGDIGKPQSMQLFTEPKVSISDQQIKHVNAVVSYSSGFKLTDVFGSYQVADPKVLKIDGFGGAIYPLTEGSTKITFKSAYGLTAESTIAVVK